MVIVFFKYLHPIDFSEVISKAVASLKIISNCSFFYFFKLHLPAVSSDPSLAKVFISHNAKTKEPDTLQRKNKCPRGPRQGDLRLPSLHAPKGAKFSLLGRLQ